MKIMVLFGQRHCSYPGQYAPECLAVMSECDYSNNPEFLLSMRSENLETGEFEVLEIVTIEVDSEKVKERLDLYVPTLQGKVTI